MTSQPTNGWRDPATILTCAEPGCSRITRALVQIDGWQCWEHAPSAGWPAPGEACDPDLDCGRSCEDDGYGGFAYEGQRGGNGYAVEDVYFTCQCEHHEVTR